MQYSTLNHEYDNSLVSNNFGFLRCPLVFNPEASDADVVVTGVPFDMATSGRAGTRHGPEAIRRSSVQLDWEGCRYPWNFRLKDRLKIADAGDLVYPFGDGAAMCARLEAHADRMLSSGKTMLTFGGDHFITLPLLRAHAKHFGKMALVHFDAHSDTYEGESPLDHGTMFHRAPKEGLIAPSKSVQLGIRTEYKASDGFLVLDGARLNDLPVDEIVRTVKARVGGSPVYLTFDIDCLDPAYAPGTGTPVVGGISTDKALKIIRGLTDVNVVGMDVVEVAPAYDHAEITSLAAATIALDMLHLLAVRR